MTRLAALLASLLLVLTACARPAQPLPEPPPPTPTSVPPLSLPRDANPHDSLTEWWYYTGHLRTPDGQRELGFEFTLFSIRRERIPVGYLAHFAVTDVTNQTFSHQARAMTGPPLEKLDVDLQGWKLISTGDADTIEAEFQPGPGVAEPFALRLTLSDRKPPVLHHGGYIDYGPAGGSYYYSRTRIDARGELRDGSGTWRPVSGQAWMDHQWGNFVVPSAGGWDWFSLQLDDNTELMLYVLRDPGGAASATYGSAVDEQGTVRDLPAGSVRLEPTRTWTSPHTGGTYPAAWTIDAPDLDLHLEVESLVPDQELYFPGGTLGGPIYWEGAIGIRGSRAGTPVVGEGYVELTGYAERVIESPTGPG